MSWICKYVDRVLSFLTFPLNIYNISICLLGIIVLIQCIAFMSLFCACNLCDRQSSYTVLCIARVCLISRLSGPRVEISFHALHLCKCMYIFYGRIFHSYFPQLYSWSMKVYMMRTKGYRPYIHYESTNKWTYFAKLSIILVVSIGTCQCNLCA